MPPVSCNESNPAVGSGFGKTMKDTQQSSNIFKYICIYIYVYMYTVYIYIIYIYVYIYICIQNDSNIINNPRFQDRLKRRILKPHFLHLQWFHRFLSPSQAAVSRVREPDRQQTRGFPCDTNINIYKPAACYSKYANIPSEKIQYLNCWDCKDSNTLSICRLCFENEWLQRCRQFLMLLQAVVSADPFLCRSLLLLGNIGQLDPLLSSIHGC